MPLKHILKNNDNHNQEAHWIPLADLMTGLMMVFMVISVLFMLKVEQDNKNIKSYALTYDKKKADLYQDLQLEFKQDFAKWGSEIDKDLTIRFNEPDVLFDMGKDNLKPKFILILNNFFPRYIKILNSPKYKSIIEEIRIEGHTSSFWSNNINEEQAYFLNMALSQSRTRTVLQHVMGLQLITPYKTWIKSHLTANGLSSSKPIYNSDHSENIKASQRVEFRLRTNAESLIRSILNKESNKTK